MRTLTIYTAPECCLCDEAAATLTPLAAELQLDLRWVDITTDPALEARFREEIPVGFLNGRKVFKYRVDEPLLRRRAARLDAAPAVIPAVGAVSSR